MKAIFTTKSMTSLILCKSLYFGGGGGVMNRVAYGTTQFYEKIGFLLAQNVQGGG